MQTRYARHLSLSEIGAEGQEKLNRAKVLCIGVGGLGSAISLYLAAAGVGTIGIVENDVVSLSNLQRQVLYTTNEVGKNKNTCARERLLALNPEINIVSHQTFLTKENAQGIISQYDIVADGTDNYAARYLINDACFQLKKLSVHASIFKFEGQCTVFNADNGPCYRCLFADSPAAGLIPTSAEVGILGVLPGVIGTIQATEIIKLITGIGEPLIGRLLLYDALQMRFREVEIKKLSTCKLCAQKL